MKKLHQVSVYVINHFCALTKHTFFFHAYHMSMYLFIRHPPPPTPILFIYYCCNKTYHFKTGVNLSANVPGTMKHFSCNDFDTWPKGCIVYCVRSTDIQRDRQMLRKTNAPLHCRMTKMAQRMAKKRSRTRPMMTTEMGSWNSATACSTLR